MQLRPPCPGCGGQGVVPLSHGYSERPCGVCGGQRFIDLAARARLAVTPGALAARRVEAHAREARRFGLGADAARAWGEARAGGATREAALKAAVEVA